MKLLKSFASMRRKFKHGMSQNGAGASYEQFNSIYPSPTGKENEQITINTKTGDEFYYCWKYYEEDDPKKKHPSFHFVTEEEQERYEWFCAGWVLFYDAVVRPLAQTTDIKREHKLFFYWDNPHTPGVAIYINDASVIKGINADIKLSYTPATATGDPPTPPPPPPPDSL